MHEYTLWARIIHTGLEEFTVVATAIPLRGTAGRPEVSVTTCKSRAAAEELRDSLAREIGAAIRERGDSVFDVEIE